MLTYKPISLPLRLTMDTSNAKNRGEATASASASGSGSGSGGRNGNGGSTGGTGSTSTTNDWEGNRETITNLYRDQNKTLKETMQIMADSHGFFAR